MPTGHEVIGEYVDQESGRKPQGVCPAIVEHIVGVDDFEVAVATYWAAVTRWPLARITLRQGARVIHENGDKQ